MRNDMAAESKFELVSTLVKLMKRAGIEDTVAFTNLGSLTIEQIKERIAEYEGKVADVGGSVKAETPVPEEAEKEAEKPKKPKKTKGTRRTKKAKTPPATPEPEPEEPKKAPETSPAQAVDIELFKRLMEEALSPLVQRVNKLEDQVRVAVDLAGALKERYDERITILRKGIEELQKGGGKASEEAEDDLSLYRFLDTLSRAAGYACDIIESEPE